MLDAREKNVVPNSSVKTNDKAEVLVSVLNWINAMKKIQFLILKMKIYSQDNKKLKISLS